MSSVLAGVGNSGGNGSAVLSKAEAEVYDRQIRLWGMEAQQKLHTASCLVYGMSGVGAEVAKNLTLCGVRSLTLMDEKAVTKNDLDSNFLLEDDPIGKNRAKASSNKAQALNPMVKFEVIESDINNMDPSFISRFTLVVLCDQFYDDILVWNDRCREHKIGFIACGVFGWVGFSFFDFNDHLFLSPVVRGEKSFCGEEGDCSSKENAIDLDSEDKMEKKSLQYPRFEEAFNVDWSKKQFVRKSKRLVPCSYFLVKAMMRAQRNNRLADDEEKNVTALTELWTEEVQHANQEVEKQTVQPENFDYLFGPQLSPVCAIVGGMAGQEAIKAMSENTNPLRNVFFYSALDSTGVFCHFPLPQ